jgi:hypothetical protein
MRSTCAAPFAYEELCTKGTRFEKSPNFVQTTGRTTVNVRDPDGWRLQLTSQLA